MEYGKIVMTHLEEFKPSRNPNWAWCYCFVPAVIGYFLILMQHINEKPIVGRIVVVNPSFYQIVRIDAKVEVISKDLLGADGPIWIEDEQTPSSYLLFSDVGRNRIFRWEEGKGPFTIGKSLHSEKAGCKSNLANCLKLKNPGVSDILQFEDNAAIDLLVSQQGERALSVFFENGTRFMIAMEFEGKRYNSPKDLVWSRDGNLYFTDSTFGLSTMEKDSNGHQEMLPNDLTHTGVYMIKKYSITTSLQDARPVTDVKLLTSELSHPTGIAISPNGRLMYVANASPKEEDMHWKLFDILEDGTLSNGRIFANTSLLSTNSTSQVGLPMGMKLDSNGNVFATAPGGVAVFSPQGQLLGQILLADMVASNVAFGGGYLFITTDTCVLRVKTLVKPAKAYRYSRK